MLKSVAGRQVPFTPQQFPIRLSRRVGLRTMPSIGAKKAVACPSGEQFVNGGFETGNFTGWTLSDPMDWECTSAYQGQGPSEGKYHARSVSLEEVTATLEQDFAIPIPVECFKDTSIFSVDTQWYQLYPPPPSLSIWQVEILYTDDTSTVLNLFADQKNVYVTHDLKALLESGKTVKGIRVTVKRATGEYAGYYIDRCICSI